MQIGESKKATIDSRPFWNDTQITLVAGQKYHFHTIGQWTDWKNTCDADGYESPNIVLKIPEGLRRMPQEKWFALIGSIDQDKNSFFLIGKDNTRTAPKTGRLYCFANDVIIAYCNNQGSIQLTVTRVA